MTKPPSEKDDETIEKEVSVILDEVEIIINDPSESVERKKEAQTMIQRAIEKGSIIDGKGKIREDIRKRYEYITRMYYNEQIQELEVIKETLKRQIEEEQKSSFTSPKRLEELKKDLKECEKTIESYKKLLEKLQQE
jgi:signal transduction protein with GAF and PtsI domain